MAHHSTSTSFYVPQGELVMVLANASRVRRAKEAVAAVAPEHSLTFPQLKVCV